MTTTAKKQSTVFPDLPRHSTLVDSGGALTHEWSLYFEQLNTALQNNYQREGVKIPSQTSADLTTIETQANLNGTGIHIGNIIYDSTTKKFKGFVLATDGGFGQVTISTVEFTTTP